MRNSDQRGKKEKLRKSFLLGRLEDAFSFASKAESEKLGLLALLLMLLVWLRSRCDLSSSFCSRPIRYSDCARPSMTEARAIRFALRGSIVLPGNPMNCFLAFSSTLVPIVTELSFPFQIEKESSERDRAGWLNLKSPRLAVLVFLSACDSAREFHQMCAEFFLSVGSFSDCWAF